MLTEKQLSKIFNKTIRAGDYVFMWSSKSYPNAPLFAAKALAKIEKRADTLGLWNPADHDAYYYGRRFLGKGKIFSIGEPLNTTHRLLQSLMRSDKLYRCLRTNSTVERFIFVGILPKQVLLSLKRTNIFAHFVFIDVPMENVKEIFPFDKTPILTNQMDSLQSTGWIENKGRGYVHYEYQYVEFCGSPSKESVYKEKRKKRYNSSFC